MRLAVILIPAALGCHDAPEVVPPWRAVADVRVEEPWHSIQEDGDVLALRFDDTPHGVRVFLGPSDRWAHAGVSPVVNGETIGTPMLAVPTGIGPAETVTVRSEGHDVLVRFASQPLNSVTTDPLAPADPTLTWIRLRPRNGSWRIVMDGLGTLNLPAESIHSGTAGTQLRGPAGTFDVGTDAPQFTTAWSPGHWQLSTQDSIHDRAPYPRTAFTWAPDADASP